MNKMKLDAETKKWVSALEKVLGVHFKNKDLLFTAFTHSSYAHENKKESNERLEFLGDSVLGIIISERLYSDSKLAAEGKLSQMRSRIVSEEPLAGLCRGLGLEKFLFLGVGEQKSVPSNAMMCDLVEAVIGAVYLDQGFKTTKKFVLRHFETLVEQTENAKRVSDSKSYLQEHYYKEGVKYKTTSEGEAHQPVFHSEVFVGGKLCGKGSGTNKRMAEKQAANEAILALESAQNEPKKKRNRAYFAFRRNFGRKKK